MAIQKSSQVTGYKVYPIDVELTDKQARSICAKEKSAVSDAQKIQSAAGHAMGDIGDGGLVLSAKVVEQLSGLMGGISDQQDIVKLVEAGLHRKDGSIEATWRPDPQYIPVLTELARTRGATVQQMAQDTMDYVTGQGWLYQLTPDTKTCFFSREQANMIAEWLGRTDGHFTGGELCEALFGKAKAA